VIDINDFPRVIRDNNCWFSAFSQLFGSKGDLDVRGTTSVIADGRKFWAHPGTEDVDSERARTHLSLIADVLDAINEPDAKQTVETIRDQLFSDEVEEHPAEIENAALKEELSEMSDTLAAVEAEKAECEKRLQGVQKRLEELEEIEAAWMDSEERLVSVSNELKAAKDEQRTSEKNRKAIVEVAKSTKTKSRKKKPSIAERYIPETTETDRDSVAAKVVEMRINSSGSKPMSWRRIREKLGLKNDQFRKVIRLSERYRKAVIQRIKKLRAQDGGWEYSGKLDVLTGIELTEEELS
jgi:chromosome segregation ATPase